MNYVALIIPYEAIDKRNPELLKRLSYPQYLPVYLFLRRYVCRDTNNPIAGELYAQGRLVSYVPGKVIAEALGISTARVSQIMACMKEWGDAVEVSYDGRHKIWELGRIETIQTPKGDVEVEVFYFDLHISSEVYHGAKKEG